MVKMKKVFIGVLLAGLLAVVVCFCSINSRKYLKFSYIGESDYTTLDFYADEYHLTDDCEFTWWEYFEEEDEDTIKLINDLYGANFELYG